MNWFLHKTSVFWIGTTEIGWLHIPGWMGTWFSRFNNWQTLVGQFIAVALVLGSYLAAQYIRVWRPRRRGQPAARIADRPPDRPADVVIGISSSRQTA